jgi:6-phosphogluconolactonase
MPRNLIYVGGCNRALPYFATANAKGIACFEVDLETGAARTAGVTEGIDNPTFLAVAPDGKSLCATSEVLGWNEGVISAYAIDPATGALTYLCKQPTRGDIAAHLAYDGTGKFAASVNYSVLPMDARPNRSLAIYPRATDGSLGPVVAEAGYEGTGKDPARQERPHAHCVRWTPDNRFVVVADLGTDRLWVHAFDAASGKISSHGHAKLPAGSGPRHFAFHPSKPFAYSVNELGSTVASFAFDAGKGSFELLAVEHTVPAAALGHNHCSAIKVAHDGKYLFVGNRGHDSIGCLAIDPATGIARLRTTTPSGGKTPRDIEFDPSGTVLAVANQDSDCISLFRYNGADGSLTGFGAPISTGTPTAISFYPGRG